MTCRSCREAILDLARDVAMPASIVEAAETHIENCTACAAELHRQRELTAALEVVSTAAVSWEPSKELEARLMDAFARNRPEPSSEDSSHGTERRRRFATGAAFAGLAAAALIVLALRVNVSERRAVVPEGVKLPEPSQEKLVASSEPVSRSVESAAIRPPAATRKARAASGRPRPAPVLPVEFMPIPSAAGLPALESGRIVRMELPMSALPAYGVESVPAGLRSSVEADLLIGQDGQARAIRLVTSQQESRSRQ